MVVFKNFEKMCAGYQKIKKSQKITLKLLSKMKMSLKIVRSRLDGIRTHDLPVISRAR